MKKEIKFCTQGELAAHLMNEEPLETGRGEIYYDPVNHPDDPFRYKSDFCDEAMKSLWDVDSHTYYTQTPWYECIPEGRYVACYVSDGLEVPDDNCPQHLVRYSDEHGCYMPAIGPTWKHATPIPADKLWIPGLEE